MSKRDQVRLADLYWRKGVSGKFLGGMMGSVGISILPNKHSSGSDNEPPFHLVFTDMRRDAQSSGNRPARKQETEQ